MIVTSKKGYYQELCSSSKSFFNLHRAMIKNDSTILTLWQINQAASLHVDKANILKTSSPHAFTTNNFL